jgi:hypothetical protein
MTPNQTAGPDLPGLDQQEPGPHGRGTLTKYTNKLKNFSLRYELGK